LDRRGEVRSWQKRRGENVRRGQEIVVVTRRSRRERFIKETLNSRNPCEDHRGIRSPVYT